MPIKLADFICVAQGNLTVLRDDLLPGGTKRRALTHMLKDISEDRIFYAGTVMGHGALALAHACADHGKDAHIFLCGDEEDPMVQRLRAAGAVLHLHPPLPIAALYAITQEHAAGGVVFPPGFDVPAFSTALARSLSTFDAAAYSEIWTASVTGTLTRAMKTAFPETVFKTVSVVKSGKSCDFTAPEKYHRSAQSLPPYPSCPYTDAKIWQFARDHAALDALIWNIAG